MKKRLFLNPDPFCIQEKLDPKTTPITFKKPRFKFTDSKLNHKSHHTVTPHLLRGPSRQKLDFIGCGQMDPATRAGRQCGGVYWFYLEFVDLSHNSLSVIGVDCRTYAKDRFCVSPRLDQCQFLHAVFLEFQGFA